MSDQYTPGQQSFLDSVRNAFNPPKKSKWTAQDQADLDKWVKENAKRYAEIYNKDPGLLSKYPEFAGKTQLLYDSAVSQGFIVPKKSAARQAAESKQNPASSIYPNMKP